MTATATRSPSAAAAFDVDAFRSRFPILSREVHGKPLVYLDNAASAQKPDAVIDAVAGYYRAHHANVHRGLHVLAEEATAAYEGARAAFARFVNAGSAQECVFVRGATEAINLVAGSMSRPGHALALGPGDKVLLTGMEHHSNIVPWQLACEATGAQIVVAGVLDDGSLDVDAFHAHLDAGGVKTASFVWVSNALGTVNPAKELVAAAQAAGAATLVDACQAAPHLKMDAAELGCDFLAVSGHKMFGPTGIGVLYGKAERLAAMPPYQGGGEMIQRVSFERSTYADPPHRFEAGTPNMAGAVGLGAAVAFMEEQLTGDPGVWAAAQAHEHALLTRATGRLEAIEGLRILGTAPGKAAVVSFLVDGVHPYDLGPVLDRAGVAIRTGHHCTEPLMARFGVPATARASFAFYNTEDEVDAFADALERGLGFFR